jgi:DNA-binding transcriptional LysR family regulator
VLAQPVLPDVCSDVAGLAEAHYAAAVEAMAACPRRTMRPAAVMLHIYRALLHELLARGWRHLDEPAWIPFDDPAIERTLLRNERLSAALSSEHSLLARAGRLRLDDLAGEPLVVYPKAPRPSYADQVLALFRERSLKPSVLYEVREVQTALGLVAAEVGVCVVPVSVEGLRRDNVVYRPLDEEKAVSPIIMNTRSGEKSPAIAFAITLICEMYRKEGIAFGV